MVETVRRIRCPACEYSRELLPTEAPPASCPACQGIGSRVYETQDPRYPHLTGREREEAIRESNQRAGGDYYGG